MDASGLIEVLGLSPGDFGKGGPGSNSILGAVESRGDERGERSHGSTWGAEGSGR